MDLGLRGKRCVVTGSTAGSGWRRRGCSRPRERRSSRAAGVARPAWGRSSTSRPTLAAGRARAADRRGPRAGVDVLVNNAGLAYQRDFLDVTDEQWQEMWEVNVMSAVRATRAVVPGCGERGGGAIVNVSSRREAAFDRDARLLGREGRAAVGLTAHRRSLCEGRDPLQRRHARPDRDRGVARRRWARRPAGGRTGKTRDEVLAAVGAGRPLGRLAGPRRLPP